MMINAYNEIYLNDAMITLAETFSFCDSEQKLDKFFNKFIITGAARQFGKGNPRYINMSPYSLYEIVMCEPPHLNRRSIYHRTPFYWCGYVLAYLQWHSGKTFEQIGRKLPPSKIIAMYNPLHEADLLKFVDVANDIMYSKETNLSRYRRNANLSQIELARLSGVSLRSIQLYEQRSLEINNASAIKLFKISKVLGCSIEDLLE